MAGYAVRHRDYFVLLDCGDGVIRRGLEAGLPMTCVDALLISHLHLDHIGDLPPLLWALHGDSETRQHRPFSLYGPPGFRDFFYQFVSLYGDWVQNIAAPIVVDEISDTEFDLGPWRVMTLPMAHGIPANGYRLQSNSKSICYTGDTGWCETAVHLASNSDLLITECSFPNGTQLATHLSAGEVGQLASQAHCRKVSLSHLYPESLAADVIGQCAEFFDGKIELATDLQRLII